MGRLKMENTLLVCLILFSIIGCFGQENAQTRIPSSLEECYNDPILLQRDMRLPMTMTTLIDLIRRIEDTPGYTSDMRTVAIALVHRFRQDGIERDPRVLNVAGVLPFSPIGMQFARHRILLSRLLPGNAITFPNNTLTSVERCTLHFMMSSSIERLIRGDEATRCSQLAQFRVERVPRAINPKFGRYEGEEIAEGDVEGGDEEPMGEEPADDPAADEELADADQTETLETIGGQMDINTNQISPCPVENGIVRTTWGAVSVGPLIAGIAAGLETQNVNIRNLVENGVFGNQVAAVSVNNIWAATLSGDLAEVTLHQSPIQATVTVGAPGAWNSTAVPRWYFLSQRENLEMTDAEIRGGIDGLILGLNMQNWRSQVGNLRLSQLLEMYYSQRGAFSRDNRACNRNNLFASAAPVQTIQAQTAAFSIVLDKEARTRATLSQDSIVSFSQNSAERLSNYIPTLTDVACDVIPTNIENNDSIYRPIAADVYIYVDTAWAFREIQPIIATYLENLNINRFGSQFTLYNANGVVNMVNTTNNLNDFHNSWNLGNHETFGRGFSLPNILVSIRDITRNLMELERQNSTVGGRSKIALLIANNAGVSEGDTTFAIQQIERLREEVPDLRILFLGANPVARFSRFVQDDRDLFTVRPATGVADTSVMTTVMPVIQRTQQIPRRIINHRCGANWQSSERGSNVLQTEVEPNGIVFYRIHPNYFFGSTDGTRRVRVQGLNRGVITVCDSRNVENPRSNSTFGNNVNCRQITSESFDMNLANACEGSEFIHQCRPFFFSVQGAQPLEGSNTVSVICGDNNCRFPDSQRFEIHTENLECFSGVSKIVGTLLPIIMSVFLVFSRFA